MWCLRENEQFDDVIFTDECLVLMENHSKITFHCKWEHSMVEGQLKHPLHYFMELQGFGLQLNAPST